MPNDDIFSKDLLQFLEMYSKQLEKPTSQFVDNDAPFSLNKGEGAGDIPPGLRVKGPQRLVRVAEGDRPYSGTHARVSELEPVEPTPSLKQLVEFVEQAPGMARSQPISEESIKQDIQEYITSPNPTPEQARRYDVAQQILTSRDNFRRPLSSGEVIGEHLPPKHRDYDIPVTRFNQFEQPTRLPEFTVDVPEQRELTLNIEEEIIPKKLAADSSLEFLKRKFGL